MRSNGKTKRLRSSEKLSYSCGLGLECHLRETTFVFNYCENSVFEGL